MREEKEIATIITARTGDRVLVRKNELHHAMKKSVVAFRVIGKSGPLSIYWHEGPYGDAIECRGGTGVAWVSPSDELLGVEFDDVSFKKDHQKLLAPDGSLIEIFVAGGKVVSKRITSYLPIRKFAD